MGTKTTITNTIITIQEPRLKNEKKAKVLHAYPLWVEFRTNNENCGACFTTNNVGQIVVPSDIGYDIWISKYDTITKKKAKFIAKIDKKSLGKKVTIEVIKTLVKNRTVKFKNVLHEADLKIIASELGHKLPTVFGKYRFSTFATALNEMMKKYEINTRLQIIHFLAQSYHETEKFSRLREKGTDTYLNDKAYKKDFCGRGLLHLTWDTGYLEYYSYRNQNIQPSYFAIHNGLWKRESTQKYKIDKKSGKLIVDKSVSAYAGCEYIFYKSDGKTIDKRGTLPINIDKILTGLALSLETDLFVACDSAGWFWKKNNINDQAKNDNANRVSLIINQHDTKALDKRIAYTEILRKVII